MTSQKCPYHVTFDLDLDLEHTLDADPSGDHRVQVWSRSSYLPARRSDFREITKVSVSREALTLTLTLSTHWMQARLGTIVCKFGGDRVMFVVEEAILV